MTSTFKIDEDLKGKIRMLLKQIVVQQHSEPNKHMIKEMPGRLNLACPVCGDSHEDSTKKRGNLYWDTLQYHCYNCGIHSNAYQLLKDYNLNFQNREDSITVIDYIQQQKIEREDIEVLELDIFKKIFDLAPTRTQLKQWFGFKDIEPGDQGFFYLRNRMLSHKLEYFMYSPKDRRLVVLNLAPQDKIIGFQTRSLNKKQNSRYLTYDIEKMYGETGQSLEATEEELISLKKISTLFGVLLVDLQRETTMFEGPIDSLFINNSIGLATAGRDTTEFDEIPTIKYMFDNDATGKKKMIEKLKRGKKIFVWDKFLKETKLDIKWDNFLQKLSKNERDTYPSSLNDLNDLIIASYHLKDKSIKSLSKYFTDNKLDAFYL